MPHVHVEQACFQPPEVRETTTTPSAPPLRSGHGPRLVAGTAFHHKPDLLSPQITTLALACLESADAARQVILTWQRQGYTLAHIYGQGITPCARLLGDWWCSDQVDFGTITIASAHLQKLLYEFSTEFVQEARCPPNNLNLLLLGEPGTQHSLGLGMLGAFFRRAGWSVSVAIPADLHEFERLFRGEWFDAIGVSVSSDRHLSRLAHLLPQLKASSANPHLHLFVGGPLVMSDPLRLNWTWADVVALDAAETVQHVTAQRVGHA